MSIQVVMYLLIFLFLFLEFLSETKNQRDPNQRDLYKKYLNFIEICLSYLFLLVIH